jgi:hypothetical protein
VNEWIQRDGFEARADRVHRYNLPVDLLFAGLTTDRETWLRLAPGEVMPAIVEAVAGERVVWSTFWPAAPNDVVVLDLSSDFPQRSRLRMRWLTDSPPDERGIGITRQRLNQKFGADIRGYVSVYFWQQVRPI